MRRARETTQNQRSVVVQKTRICNYGQARYKLANALQGASGYSLTENFKNAVRLLPSTYSVPRYMGFLDDWGTVSQLSVLMFLVTMKEAWLLASVESKLAIVLDKSFLVYASYSTELMVVY